MCNPAPGSRCVSSATKSLKSQVKTFQAAVDAAARLEQQIPVIKGDKEREEYIERYENVSKSIEKGAAEINNRKIFVYAANAKSDIQTEAEMDAMTKSFGDYEKSLLASEDDLHKTGVMLRKFQNTADKVHKDNKEKEDKSLSNEVLAKNLAEKAYPELYKAMKKTISTSIDAKGEKGTAEDKRRAKAAKAKALALLDQAYSLAKKDAEKLYAPKKDEE